MTGYFHVVLNNIRINTIIFDCNLIQKSRDFLIFLTDLFGLLYIKFVEGS